MAAYRKKLIEVALPLQAINEASAREKSIRHGHPSTLHLWWARRPLAACRAVLFAQLVDDPDSDPVYRKSDGSVDEEAAGIKRAELFNLIEELVQWENSNNPDVIRSARAEIARCVASRKLELGELAAEQEVAPGITVKHFIRDCRCLPIFVGTETNTKKNDKRRFQFGVSHLPPEEVVNTFLAAQAPPVLDPFAGGGSIPLEAQRLGLRAYASDLNPVPVLINKALIEIPSRYAGHPAVNPQTQGGTGTGKRNKSLIEKEWSGATGLAEDVRYYGKWIRDEAEKRIGHLYPNAEVTEEMVKDQAELRSYIGKKVTVIAWLWCRSVASPNPALGGTHVPLIKSFWLAKKANKRIWLRPVISRTGNQFSFEITNSKEEPPPATISRKGGRCLISDTPISFDYIRNEGKAGRMGTLLLAMVCDGGGSRIYLPATPQHDNTAKDLVVTGAPDMELANNPFSLRPPLYGLNTFASLFTSRQLLALTTFSDLFDDLRNKIKADASLVRNEADGLAYAQAVSVYIAFSLDKAADYWSALCSWHNSKELIRNTFGRQALPMIWDFAEANPFQSGTGGFGTDWSEKVLRALFPGPAGEVEQLDSTASRRVPHFPVISTDPPYYNNIDYADLSDFFYVWLRRSIGGIYPSLFATVATPKSQELVATPYRHGGDKGRAKTFFEEGLSKSFGCMHATQHVDYPVTVFYAFKQAEEDEHGDDPDISEATATIASTGWETMLDAVQKSGFVVNGTWPMRTEMGSRMMSMGMNALASSVVLVCRPRETNAPLATRKEFITALRRELPEALRSLQQGNIAPVDLAQSAIGPGMAVFTRYAKVLESDGSTLSIRTALGLINQTLDEVLAEQEGEFDGDTRWALAWFEQFGMNDGPFGDAETLSKAKNTAVNGLVAAGIILAKSGKVRLVRRDELPSEWNPTTDKRLTVWEVTQHLIYRLDEQGESGAAVLVGQLGSVGEIARDLAYRLYSICERKKWAQEALAYNSLVVAWPELTKLSRAQRSAQTVDVQQALFTQ